MTGSISLNGQVERTIDYSPLIRRLIIGEVLRFRIRSSRSGVSYPALERPGLTDLLSVLGAVIVTIPLVVLELVVLFFIVGSLAAVEFNIVIGLVSITLSALCFYVIWRDQPLDWAIASPWPQRFRIAEFSRVNGFDFDPESASPFSPVDPQAIPGSGIASNRLIDTNHPQLEIANLRYTMLSWVDPVQIHIGYLAVERPPRFSPKSLADLQRSLDGAGLGITIAMSDEWIILNSDTSFDLAAPHTYRMLFWIATLIDQRRARLEPVSADTFAAEALRISKMRQDQFAKRLFSGSVAIAAVWVACALLLQTPR